MTHRSRILARLHRWLDRKRNGTIRPTITQYQWDLMQGNMAYRLSRYWQINQGNG